MNNNNIKDSYEQRLAYIAKDSSTRDITNNRRVYITLTSTLPAVHIENNLLVNRELMSKNNNAPVNSIINTLASDDDIVVAGEETVYRFTFISRAVSNLFKNTIDMYYDNKYNDIIIIPTTNYMGDETTSNILTNTVANITGFRIGGGCELDYTRIGNKYISLNHKFNIPKMDDRLDNKFMYINLPGLHTQHGSEFIKTNVSEAPMTDVFNSSNRGVCVTTLTLASTIAMPVYSVVQYNVDSFRLQYLGIKKVSTFSFLLDY